MSRVFIYSNVFRALSLNKANRSIGNLENLKDKKWIEIYHSFGSKPIKLKYTEDAFYYYFKPTERYYVYQFEEFFGFGCGNIEFDKDRIIKIPKFK